MASTAAAVLSKALAKSRSKFEDGTVVRFTLTGGNLYDIEATYLFVAIYIKARKSWFLSGAGWRGRNQFTEEAFLRLLEDAENIEVATEFEAVK